MRAATDKGYVAHSATHQYTEEQMKYHYCYSLDVLKRHKE